MRLMKLDLRHRTACVSLALLLLAPLRAQEASSSLYGQAATMLLDRSFPSTLIEYLLLDVRTRQILAVRWPNAELPIPVGSLLKPFVALAYGEVHAGTYSSSSFSPSRQFPVLHCRGKRDGCWREGGHGSVALEQAIAESCNAYFLALARDLSASGTGSGSGDGLVAIDRVSAAYGLPAPPPDSITGQGELRIPRMLIGVTPEWRISPIALAHAYATLAAQSQSAFTSRLLRGMKLAAGPGGTASKVGRHPGGVLAKTGTAPCVPGADPDSGRCVANGDGLVVVLSPAENPELLLLVRQRGTTGAQTAEVAGQMLSRLEGNHASAR